MKEVELKLTLQDAEQGRQLFDLPVIAHYCTVEPLTHDIWSVYYDTPDFAAFQQKIAIRIRQVDDGYCQTVKILQSSAEKGLQQCQEFESALSVAELDKAFLQRLVDDGKLPKDFPIEACQPIFETHFSRTVWQLELDTNLHVECALDIGEVIAGEQVYPIQEIELELKSGSKTYALFEIAADIAFAIPVSPSLVPKSWWGYQLAQANNAGQTFKNTRESEWVGADYFIDRAQALREAAKQNH